MTTNASEGQNPERSGSSTPASRPCSKELKRFAEDLRVPVSNLIRTILEDALTAADQAGERVERSLRAGAARLAHGRNNLRRTLVGHLPGEAAPKGTDKEGQP